MDGDEAWKYFFEMTGMCFRLRSIIREKLKDQKDD